MLIEITHLSTAKSNLFDKVKRDVTSIVVIIDFHSRCSVDITKQIISVFLKIIFRFLFSSCRIPGETIDELVRYPESKHAVVSW